MDNNNQIDTNDIYIRHKKTYFKLSIISGVLLVVFISLAVVFRFKMDAINPHYQTVNVYIESVYDARIGNDVLIEKEIDYV